CQGACVNAPMVMIFKDAYEDLTPERLAEIIDEFEAGRGADVPAGPQNERIYSAPITGLTSLTDEKAILKSNGGKQKGAAGPEARTAPSQAARPKTDAIETSPAVRSPSQDRVHPAQERAASVPAPSVDHNAADRAEPSVEGTARPRAHSGKAAAGEARKPSLESRDRPAGIARPERPDDLKLISGIGPKSEAILHSLGVFTFAQVAAWEKAEREWVDGYLRFGGRIEREDWVGQARALAKGGEAEYIRVFGKKPR